VQDQIALKRQIVEKIIEIEAQLEFSSALYPANAEEQREKFLSGENKNPIFMYPKIDIPSINRQHSNTLYCRCRIHISRIFPGAILVFAQPHSVSEL